MPLLNNSSISRILIADDMATNRAMLAFAFKSTAFEIVQAADGEEVLELVKHQIFDCLLLDQLMPGLSGYETLIQLRKQFSQVQLPIIIVTALYDAKNITIALKNGANDYVTKPVDPNVILARVNLQLERRKIESELLLAKEKAEKANQDKSMFISSMSHELKTPLNAILGFSQLIEMSSRDNQKVLNSLKQITYSSNYLLNMINELLDISKIESENTAEYENFYVPEMLEALSKSCVPLIDKNSNHLEISCANTQEEMLSHKSKLTQILLNLISNAAKFTQNGNIQVIVNNFDDHRWLSFSVKDTGIGISEANQQKLFSDFFQIQESQHLNPQGTGLGLSISLRLTQLLGGTISVKSILGQGSEFIVKLPRVSPKFVTK